MLQFKFFLGAQEGMKNGWWIPPYILKEPPGVLCFFSPLAIWSLIFKHLLYHLVWLHGLRLFITPLLGMKNRTREGMMGWRVQAEIIRKADPKHMSTVAPSTVVVHTQIPRPKRLFRAQKLKGGTSSANKIRTQMSWMFSTVQVEFILFSDHQDTSWKIAFHFSNKTTSQALGQPRKTDWHSTSN